MSRRCRRQGLSRAHRLSLVSESDTCLPALAPDMSELVAAKHRAVTPVGRPPVVNKLRCANCKPCIWLERRSNISSLVQHLARRPQLLCSQKLCKAVQPIESQTTLLSTLAVFVLQCGGGQAGSFSGLVSGVDTGVGRVENIDTGFGELMAGMPSEGLHH